LHTTDPTAGQEPAMTTLEHVLARALTEIVTTLDLDDVFTPESTMAVLDPVTALLQDLTEADRQTLTELINQCAQQETDPERHLAAWETPQTLDLLT
jgi:hypothetical protein